MKKIGLLLVMLCCVFLLGCKGSSLNEKRGKLVRIAAASEPELQAWLDASNKSGPDGALREADTNGDGAIDDGDLTNEALRKAGVCTQWMAAMEVTGGAEVWSLEEEPLKVACIQQSADTLDIVATDKSGEKLWLKTLSPK